MSSGRNLPYEGMFIILSVVALTLAYINRPSETGKGLQRRRKSWLQRLLRA